MRRAFSSCKTPMDGSRGLVTVSSILRFHWRLTEFPTSRRFLGHRRNRVAAFHAPGSKPATVRRSGREDRRQSGFARGARMARVVGDVPGVYGGGEAQANQPDKGLPVSFRRLERLAAAAGALGWR